MPSKTPAALTRLLPPTARSMRRIDRITGRSDDMLIMRGANVFPSQIEELIFKQAKLSPHCQIEVSRDGHLDSMRVNVESSPNSPAVRKKNLWHMTCNTTSNPT
jgi:phenylacetate-CoA ligase